MRISLIQSNGILTLSFHTNPLNIDKPSKNQRSKSNIADYLLSQDYLEVVELFFENFVKLTLNTTH